MINLGIMSKTNIREFSIAQSLSRFDQILLRGRELKTVTVQAKIEMRDEEKLKKYGFDLKVQKRARQYHFDNLKLNAFDSLLSLAALLVFAWLGSACFARWVEGFLGGAWVINLMYVLIFTTGFLLFSLPFDWQGYKIERRYDLSTQKPKSWFIDQFKGNLISLIISLLALPTIYVAISWSNLWWIYGWVAGTAFTVFMGFIAPTVLMPLFYDFEPLEDKELFERLNKLAEKAGVEIVGVFKMAAGVKTKKAIGALAGIGSSRRIILSDTLLEKYTPDEIATVIAHELGHHKHNDMGKGIVQTSVMILLGFYIAHLVLGSFAGIFGLSTGIASLPVLLVTLGAIFFITSPLTNTLSRIRERTADRFALKLSGKPEAQAKVFVKLSEQNLSYVNPHPLIEFLFYDHPAAIKRVEQALELK